MSHWTKYFWHFFLWSKRKFYLLYHSTWPLNFDPCSACLPRKRTLRISVGRSVLSKELLFILRSIKPTPVLPVVTYTFCYSPRIKYDFFLPALRPPVSTFLSSGQWYISRNVVWGLWVILKGANLCGKVFFWHFTFCSSGLTLKTAMLDFDMNFRKKPSIEGERDKHEATTS